MRIGAALLLLFAACAASAAPRRIVSLNPCADAILMEIADPAQIAGVSHYSHKASSASVPVSWAHQFPAVGPSAEELLALSADLVVAGPHVSPQTVAMIGRLGMPMISLSVPGSIAESRAQITQLAAAIGAPARGRALNARMDRALAAARPVDGRMVPALIRMDGGLVPGTGTLADEMLRTSGFANMASAYGLAMWDVLPLEPLVARPPAMLFAPPATDRTAMHPVLRRVQTMRTAAFDNRLLLCAGPTIARALDVMAAARRRM